MAKALNKLGVPSAKDINALIERIDELNKAVQKLSAKAPATKTTAPAVAAKTKATATPKAKTPAKKTKASTAKQD